MNSPRQGNETPLLEVRELTVHHGQLRALDHVSLRVFPGEVYLGSEAVDASTIEAVLEEEQEGRR